MKYVNGSFFLDGSSEQLDDYGQERSIEHDQIVIPRIQAVIEFRIRRSLSDSSLLQKAGRLLIVKKTVLPSRHVSSSSGSS